MPSPLAHLAAGAAVATLFVRKDDSTLHRQYIWGTALFFSIAPDLDAIPGFITGNMAMYHNQFTHSFFFGFSLCLLAAGVFGVFSRRFLDWRSYPRIAFVALFSYGLHLVMDAMTLGPGVKLLWPFSDERFSAPVTLFYGVRHSEGLFSLSHLITIGNELMIIGGFLLLVRLALRTRQHFFGTVPTR
ncbi:metal-dependent hydrolase [Desulfonatronum parangueonense]